MSPRSRWRSASMESISERMSWGSFVWRRSVASFGACNGLPPLSVNVALYRYTFGNRHGRSAWQPCVTGLAWHAERHRLESFQSGSDPMFSRFFSAGRRSFDTLSEQEILALAISSEEEDARIYRDYAAGLRADFPASAKVFEEMALEEDGHRAALVELHRRRFGEHIPLIRREHVRGYFERKPDWLVRPLGLERVRAQAALMERQARQFYLEAAQRASDASTRKLL